MKIVGQYDESDWFGEVTVDGKVLDPKPSQKVFNHSPDGFAWGYGGSGPAQLALAILLAANVPAPKAIALHHRFKSQFLATLPRDTFSIDVDIDKWVAEASLTTAVPTDDTESER